MHERRATLADVRSVPGWSSVLGLQRQTGQTCCPQGAPEASQDTDAPAAVSRRAVGALMVEFCSSYRKGAEEASWSVLSPGMSPERWGVFQGAGKDVVGTPGEAQQRSGAPMEPGRAGPGGPWVLTRTAWGCHDPSALAGGF